jgi:hypothetical protein
MELNDRLQSLKRRVDDRRARREQETVVGLRYLAGIFRATREGLAAKDRAESPLPAIESMVEQTEEALDQMDALAGNVCLDGEPIHATACGSS